MSAKPRTLTLTYVPAAVLAAVLVLPIAIDTIAHAELSTGLALGVCALLCIASLAQRRPLLPIEPLTVSLLLLIGVLAGRAAVALEPAVAFYGAYNIDATVWVFACIAQVVLATRWWSDGSPADARDAILGGALAVVTLYAAASSVLAAVWGTTDGVGGPPSGLTPNSQYQLQLTLLGVAAAAAWAWSSRRKRPVALLAAAAGACCAVGVVQCRASSTYPGLIVAAVVGGVVFVASRGGRARLTAAVGTAGVALLGFGTLAALSAPATAPALIELLDRFGGGRGTLWASAAHVLSTNLLAGRGLAHATAVTRWTLQGEVFELTSTVDPHNLFITLGIGGGLLALAAGLGVAFTVQRAILDAAAGLDHHDAITRALVVAGAAAVFTVSQFAFVYPVAWMLAAALLGLSGALSGSGKAPSPTIRPAVSGFLTAAALVATLALVAFAPTSMAPRIESLHARLLAQQTDPVTLLGLQLELVRSGADVMPAGAAIDVLSEGLRGSGQQAAAYVTQVNERLDTVNANSVWDARLAAAELELWSAAAPLVPSDPNELDRIVRAGIAADPGSGLWAAAGAAIADRHGLDTQAVRYARLVAGDPAWLAQTRASADTSTAARIEDLAAE